MREFEDGLLSLLRGKNVDILNAIRDSRDLSDDVRGQAQDGGRGLRQDVCCLDAVMAGLVPAIHVLGRGQKSKTWMPGDQAGHDEREACGRVLTGSPG